VSRLSQCSAWTSCWSSRCVRLRAAWWCSTLLSFLCRCCLTERRQSAPATRSRQLQRSMSINTNYYGAVLSRRRPHHVSILSVCPSVPCLLLFTYRFRYVSLNSYGKRNSHSNCKDGPITGGPSTAAPSCSEVI